MRVRLLVALVVLLGVFAFLSNTADAPEADQAERAGLPLIESGETKVPVVSLDQITFYAEGDAGAAPRLVSDLTGWGERADGTFDFSVGRMRPIAGTNWFTLTVRSSAAARIEYLFAYGAGDYRMDPRNPRRVRRANGEASEVAGPSYVRPPEFDAPPTEPAGKIFETMVPGLIIKERRVIVYTPPGYDPSRTYRLAIFHDGGLVVNTGEAPRVLDWLITHDAIHPVVAVFVDPVSRVDDFHRDAPMRDFVGTELMTWISSRYSITPIAADHAIIGISAGARAALNAMASYPGVFGRSGLMIPALDEADVLKIPVRRGEEPQLEVAVLVAAYDPINSRGAGLVRDSLTARGQSVKYIEVPEGHSTITWKTHLRDVMITLFGR